MKKYIKSVLLFILSFSLMVSASCNNKQNKNDKVNLSLIDTEATILKDRIKAPSGFKRIETKDGSFENFLQNLPLRPHGTELKHYNGKNVNSNSYIAVLDWDITPKDLEQCADAVIRLRAEYLYAKKDYGKISFNFVSGFKCEYQKWLEGYRVNVNGNDVTWEKSSDYDDSYECFRQYLDTVHMYASTLSLDKELTLIEDWKDMQIGDVFIKPGKPGHAIIIVDMAVNETTGENIFVVAQSAMPAQQTHILKNFNDTDISPWFKIPENHEFTVAGWKFEGAQLKRFT